MGYNKRNLSTFHTQKKILHVSNNNTTYRNDWTNSIGSKWLSYTNLSDLKWNYLLPDSNH